MCSCNLYHIDIRCNVRKYAFHVGKSPGKHGQTVRHLDFIVLHDLHQICHYFRHINLPHLHTAILHQKSVYILIKLSLIRPRS